MSWCPSPTQAVVDLSAIVHNLAQVRERAGDRLVMLAIKADGYGHGAVPIALEVERTGAADWLAVANVSEGQKLLDAGVGLPILKLSPPLPRDLDAATASGMRLTVTDLADVAATETSAARTADPTRAAGPVRVHIGVDTGMGRIGLGPDRLAEMARAVDAAPHLELEGIFTHLPVSDVPTGVDFTRAQIGRFLAAVDDVVALRGPVPQVHLANSGAILGHDLGTTTMVRAGIVAYGYDPDPEAHRADLRPALTWRSWVSFVKTVEPGDSVGYGRTWTAPRRTQIVTVPVGYADGYSRALSNRGTVLVQGRRCPVVGRVCMDQIMVDVGPDATVAVGEEVVLLGRQGDVSYDADEMAEVLGTISYEITCDLSARVDRVWVNGVEGSRADRGREGWGHLEG
ncbi:alanine racemase [Acidipropionibacterium timonense]|uniref:alanine racemase n=1 Tax=Acidipropionibacterium timonense TaxID=2161818 RepID=UPI001030A6A2|nr:alanine racemase [Acidipropionibacterium timonense]